MTLSLPIFMSLIVAVLIGIIIGSILRNYQVSPHRSILFWLVTSAVMGAAIGFIVPTAGTIIIATIATGLAVVVFRAGDGKGGDGIAYAFYAGCIVIGIIAAGIVNIFVHPDFANLLLRIQ